MAVREHFFAGDRSVRAAERESKTGTGGRKRFEAESGKNARAARVPRIRDDESARAGRFNRRSRSSRELVQRPECFCFIGLADAHAVAPAAPESGGCDAAASDSMGRAEGGQMRGPEQMVADGGSTTVSSRCGLCLLFSMGWDVFYSARVSIRKPKRDPAGASVEGTSDCIAASVSASHAVSFPGRAVRGPDSRYHAEDSISSSAPVDFIFTESRTIGGWAVIRARRYWNWLLR